MKKFKKFSRVVAMMLCMMMVLTACGSKSDSDTKDDTGNNDTSTPAPTTAAADKENNTSDPAEIKTGGTLTVGTLTTLTNIGYTPELGSNANIKFARTAYQSLLNYDGDGNLVGELATDWSYDADALTITYNLREGVTFSDGTPFNSEAVKWNFEEYAASNRTEVGGIASIDTPDEYTVTITLGAWNSSKLESIGYFVYFMSPTAIKDNGKEWAYTNTCGTGPFVSESVVEGSSISYTKNTSYWEEGKPYLDKVVFNIFSDNNTADFALQNMEMDVYFDAPIATVTSFDGMDGYKEYTNTNGYGKETLGLIPSSANEYNEDGSVNPFYDERVRQALCYAVDAFSLNQVLSQGIKPLTNQWAAEGSSTYSPNVTGYEYNPEKAKELLKEAGYEDGFTTQVYDGGGTFTDACTLVQSFLEEVGITCNINTVDSTTFMGLMYNGWEGLFWHFASITPDLGFYMGRHLDYNATFYATGIQHPDDAMDLLEKIRTATSEEDKQKYSWELEDVIYNKYALFGKVINVSAPYTIAADYVEGGAWGQSHASAWDAANCWMNK